MLKNTKVNLKHYQMKVNRKKHWAFRLVERLDPAKIHRRAKSEEGSGEDVCSRRSTIDFNDLEDPPEDDELGQQNPFLLGRDGDQEESENGMFLEESADQSQGDLAPLVVDEGIPQAKIVGFGEGGQGKAPPVGD